MSDGSEQMPPTFVPEREGFDRYLEDTIVVDWQTPSVTEQARLLAEGCDDEAALVRALFRFVRDEISHSLDVETDVVSCNASQVLRERTGLCYAKSHLLVALLRARGIPGGFGYQRLRRDPPGRGHVLHGFALAWLADREAWVVLDPRGNRDSIHTEADFDTPSLAFEPDPEAGERTLPTIFVRPARPVVDMLDQADSLARIRDHLPGDVV